VSGLLRALGAQALNVAPTLRPAALRHAAVPAREEGLEEWFEFDAFDAMAPADAPATSVRAGAILHEAPEAYDVPREPRRSAPSEATGPLPDARPTWMHDRDEAATHHLRAAREPESPALPFTHAPTVRPRSFALPMADPGRANARANPPTPAQPPPPPDVHIHIGRIEVTAASPPPAPKRERPAPSSKSPSLEDYLRRGTKAP